MKKKVITLIVIFSSVTALLAQINRSFWKSDSQIDEFYGKASADRGAAAQHESLREISDRISNLDQFKHYENIDFLGESLRKLSRNNIYQLKERFDVYDEVQKSLLAIPGHASYFAASLEAKREELKPGDYRGSYDDERLYLIRQTLVHLPSPETVRVLGEYLFDERDDPSSIRTPTTDLDLARGSGHLAAGALANIGLRNPPIRSWREGYLPEDEEALRSYRDWYKKVKAGEIPFSFVGQSVEYRFQPDGSVIETPIEIPEEELIEAASDTLREPAEKPAVEPAKERDITSSEEPSPWIWIAIAALLSGVLVLLLRTRLRSG